MSNHSDSDNVIQIDHLPHAIYQSLGDILDHKITIPYHKTILEISKWGGYDMREGCDICGEFSYPLFLHLNLKELHNQSSDSLVINDLKIVNDDKDDYKRVTAIYHTNDKVLIEKMMLLVINRDGKEYSPCISTHDFTILSKGGIFSTFYTGDITEQGTQEFKAISDVDSATICHNCYLWLDCPSECKLVSPFFGFWMDVLEDIIIYVMNETNASEDDIKYLTNIVNENYKLCKKLC